MKKQSSHSQTYKNTERSGDNQSSLWEKQDTPLPKNAEDDPYGHIAFYRALELM
jgi:hypothetical protein